MFEVDRIVDSDFSDFANESFDFAFFASGYETRARLVASKVSPTRIGRVVVLGFDRLANVATRKANDRFFKRKYGIAPSLANSLDDSTAFQTIEKTVSHANGRIRVLVDYTSMSRTWYAAILNWFRYRYSGESAEIVFTYSAGRYKRRYPSRVIQAIKPIPGCEGYSDPTHGSVAVFGLGYENFASLTALDYLEPDETFGVIAAPDVDGNSGERTERANRDFLEQTNTEIIRFPLMSVTRAYSGMAELVSPYVGIRNISMVCLGPKTHVLASILLSMRFANITCLHVQGHSDQQSDVLPQGNICATKVALRPTISDAVPSDFAR
jgi:hypothetical protein